MAGRQPGSVGMPCAAQLLLPICPDNCVEGHRSVWSRAGDQPGGLQVRRKKKISIKSLREPFLFRLTLKRIDLLFFVLFLF